MVYRVTRTCATLEIFLLDQITFPNIDKKNDEKDREQSLKGWNGTKNYRFIYIYIYVSTYLRLSSLTQKNFHSSNGNTLYSISLEINALSPNVSTLITGYNNRNRNDRITCRSFRERSTTRLIKRFVWNEHRSNRKQEHKGI